MVQDAREKHTTSIVTHFEENQEMKRIRLRSSGDFAPGAICGNGSYHAKLTNSLNKVTCEKCLSKIKK